MSEAEANLEVSSAVAGEGRWEELRDAGGCVWMEEDVEGGEAFEEEEEEAFALEEEEEEEDGTEAFEAAANILSFTL